MKKKTLSRRLTGKLESQFIQKGIRAKRLVRISCLGDNGIRSRVRRSPQLKWLAAFCRKAATKLAK
jgi:hypothetical protein